MSFRSPEKYANDLRLSREAKRRRTGTCVDCGATTRYNGHGVAVSARCVACANARRGEATRGQGFRQQQIATLLASGTMRFCEIREALGASGQLTSILLRRAVRYGIIRRVSRGVYALASEDTR